MKIKPANGQFAVVPTAAPDQLTDTTNDHQFHKFFY